MPWWSEGVYFRASTARDCSRRCASGSPRDDQLVAQQHRGCGDTYMKIAGRRYAFVLSIAVAGWTALHPFDLAAQARPGGGDSAFTAFDGIVTAFLAEHRVPG